MILGAHLSIAGGVHKAIEKTKMFNIKAIQIFTKNQNRWIGRPFTKEEIELYFKLKQELSIGAIVSHASYLINLASNDKNIQEKSYKAMLDEITRCDLLEIPYLVLHPGSHLGAGENLGLETVANNIKKILSELSTSKIIILFETTAGQGTNLGWNFEQLSYLLELINIPEKTGICLDTCHMFAAGYDFRTYELYQNFKKILKNNIDIDKVRIIHLNDSKYPCGSRKDRHEQIGDGLIGKNPFSFFLNDKDFEKIPGILETPLAEEGYKKDLEILQSLIH